MVLDFIEIDGSLGEGGGQILRTSVSLSAALQKPVKVTNIRARRREPGLRPQHLQAVLAASRICKGKLAGASVGSTEIEFIPGPLPEKYEGIIDTHTAASTALIAQTIVPISILGGVTLDLEICGGTEVPNSPTIDYISHLVLPVYERLGGRVSIQLKQRGYYPRGGGAIRLKSSRQGERGPSPIHFEELSPSSFRRSAAVISVSRGLPEHVARRQEQSARRILEEAGWVDVKSERDSVVGRFSSPGSSVLVFSEVPSQLLGSSSLGERGKRAETVGEEAAKNFLRECSFCPNVDSHLADMLVTLLCLVPGVSRFVIPFPTNHFLTNVEVARRMSKCKIDYTERDGQGWIVEISGIPEKPN